MRLSAVAVLMIITTVFLSGCAKDNMAALDDRQNNYYGRNGTLSAAAGTRLTSGAASYASASVPQATQSDVPVMSVTATDLPPPTATASAQPMAAPSVTRATAANWQWPVDGKVTERYGKQADGTSNEGITIAAPMGTPIRAAQSGQVAFVGQDTKNYGNIVILRHADGEMTSYAHARDITVQKGAQVNAGSIIGYVGQSGNAKAPELHFALRDGNHGVDPLSKLPQKMASGY